MQRNGVFLRTLNLICLSLLLTACGFHLRSSVEFPVAYRTVFIEETGGRGLLRQELIEQLGYSGVSIVDKKTDAGLVIHILSEKKDTRTLSLSRGGKSTELELTYRVRYELIGKEDEKLLAEQELELVRNYFNDQTDVIGKSNEESLIFAEMKRLMADSLLRRARTVLAD